MSSKEKRPLLKTKVQKKPMKATDGGSIKYENELRFEDNVGDQRGANDTGIVAGQNVPCRQLM